MRCLNYRLIKMHRKFTSDYLLCDKASLRRHCSTGTHDKETTSLGHRIHITTAEIFFVSNSRDQLGNFFFQSDSVIAKNRRLSM
jgi:hypothetical protein